jgi:hypothetical protein
MVGQALSNCDAGIDHLADALHHASYRSCASVATFADRKFALRARKLGMTPRRDHPVIATSGSAADRRWAALGRCLGRRTRDTGLGDRDERRVADACGPSGAALVRCRCQRRHSMARV